MLSSASSSLFRPGFTLLLSLALITFNNGLRSDDSKIKDPSALLAEHCLSCHAQPGPWPDIAGLSKLSSEEIYRIITSGLMQELAVHLDDDERRAIASYLGNLNPQKPVLDSGGMCKEMAAKTKAHSESWNGWSPDNRNHRFVPAHDLRTPHLARLTLKWAFVFPDTAPFTSAGNQPTVADGRLYVGNMNGMVYALDATSGCTWWSYRARTHVRSNIVVAGDTLVFADYETNVYALDASTGSLRWMTRADEQASARMNGNITVHKDIAYIPISSNQEFTVSWRPETVCCTFRGAIAAIDINSGKIAWKTSLIDEPLRVLGKNSKGVDRYGPSGAAVWSVPSVDEKRGLLYVTTGNQFTEPRVDEADALVALDLGNGKKKWSRSFVPDQFTQGDIWHSGCEAKVMFTNAVDNCPPVNPEHEGDREIGSPAVLKTLPSGREILLVATKDGVLYATDPDNRAKTIWEIRLSKLKPGRGPILGGIEHGIALDDTYAYVPIADMSPLLQTAYGGIASVELETGKLSWSVQASEDSCRDRHPACNNAYMGAPTLLGNVLFAGSNDGYLRAFDNRDGRIIWSFDSARQFTGVNGLQGSGGAINRVGPTVANGMLYQTSGYGHLGVGMPGNVLLAFEFPDD